MKNKELGGKGEGKRNDMCHRLDIREIKIK